MQLWRIILLLSIIGLALVSFAKCDPDIEEDEDEGDDDGQVEVEEGEEPPVEAPARLKPTYERPVPSKPVFFHEPFDSLDSFSKKWVLSEAKKDGAEETVAKYDGKWDVEEPKTNPLEGDLGLILKSKAKHHAVSSALSKPFDFSGNPLVVQYEVRFQNGMDCGGAYVKLLSGDSKMDLNKFNDKTPYTVMFGPDKCGMDNKMHFIFRHKNPKTGEIEEKHAKKPTATLDSYFTDRQTHLYTLVVNPDQTFEMLIDNSVVNKGSLLEDVSPPVNPTKEIEDPDDKKPEDWDDREKIADPEAEKPEDWDESQPASIVDPDATKPDGWLDDEPRLVPDPEAAKPTDWDDEMDGEWEAPLIDNTKCKEAPGCGDWEAPTISNPLYKGKWSAPMVDNPAYKGVWKARMIDNPAYFEDSNPYKMTPIGAVGLELWSMSDEIVFDNFLITDDPEVAKEFASISWAVKSTEEKAASSAGGVIQTLMSAAETRPWLWAVYVVVLLLPVVLLSICLCPKGGPVKPEDISARRKKTDEASPDDEEEDDEDEEAEEGKEGAAADIGGGGDAEGAKVTQADLEATEENKDEGEEADAEEDEDAKKTPSPKKSPRRRKARKE